MLLKNDSILLNNLKKIRSTKKQEIRSKAMSSIVDKEP